MYSQHETSTTPFSDSCSGRHLAGPEGLGCEEMLPLHQVGSKRGCCVQSGLWDLSQVLCAPVVPEPMWGGAAAPWGTKSTCKPFLAATVVWCCWSALSRREEVGNAERAQCTGQARLHGSAEPQRPGLAPRTP